MIWMSVEFVQEYTKKDGESKDFVGCGEEPEHETMFNSVKALFKSCQKEYGRCSGRMWIDKDGKSIPIGWIFEKTSRYEDTHEPFVIEAWVTLYEKPTEIIKKHHYLELKGATK